MRLSRLIATVGGIGLLRPAPGTWGSLAALPMAWVLHVIAGPWFLILAIIVTFFKGLWATSKVIRDTGEPDPSEIVIDEVEGQWIAFLPVSIGAAWAGAALVALWPGWITAFAFFRLFDIWKPGPIGRVDRRKDALGVMLDDVIAGVFAAFAVAILAALAHLGMRL